MNGDGPLVPVGWYENATFENDWAPRREYSVGEEFPPDRRGKQYSFTVKAKNAHLIPVDVRPKHKIKGSKHLRSTPILYARGQGDSSSWRESYARLAGRIVGEISVSRTRQVGRGRLFPEFEHSKRVERQSIRVAKRWLRTKGYRVRDYQDDNVGYDLGATPPGGGRELQVEVKGTSETYGHFYLTRNEYAAMSERVWRLLLVTQALSQPQVHLFTRREVRQKFQFEPLSWEASAHS